MIIYDEDKSVYYMALRQYDEQETLDALVSFFEEQTIKTWSRAMKLSQEDAPERRGLKFFIP